MAGGVPIPANHAILLNRDPDREPGGLCRERRATSTTARGLRILKNEAAAHQVFLVIQRSLI
jgi:hypothetical protein